MARSVQYDDVLKENMLRLIAHHKKHCEGETCNISLMWVLEVMKRAGIELTEQDRIRFNY